MSFLGPERYHVFVTGAAGGIGSQVVKEFLGTSFTRAYTLTFGEE
jgi:NAD(P)-dependent dehydrogenase (short-subunit alcohol dehydrogenase family)